MLKAGPRRARRTLALCDAQREDKLRSERSHHSFARALISALFWMAALGQLLSSSAATTAGFVSKINAQSRGPAGRLYRWHCPVRIGRKTTLTRASVSRVLCY